MSRTEICAWCGDKWNVSKNLVIVDGLYECPSCEKKRLRAMVGQPVTRRKNKSINFSMKRGKKQYV